MAAIILVVVVVILSVWMLAIAASRLSPNSTFVQKYINWIVPKPWRGTPSNTSISPMTPSSIITSSVPAASS